MKKFHTPYGLPSTVQYCKKCVISNQRPSSVVEFKNSPSDIKPTISFNEEGICSACQYHEQKVKHVDWKTREEDLLKLLDRFRKNDGSYDVVAPGS